MRGNTITIFGINQQSQAKVSVPSNLKMSLYGTPVSGKTQITVAQKFENGLFA